MNTRTCTFVEISSLSNGIPDDAWDAIMDSFGDGPNGVTWGTEVNCLVDAPRLLANLKYCDEDEFPASLAIIKERLESVPNGILVDLCN